MRVKFTTEVEVTDAQALEKYARDRISIWGTDEDYLITDSDGMLNLGKCVVESLLASNENPSPDEYGISIIGWEIDELRW